VQENRISSVRRACTYSSSARKANTVQRTTATDPLALGTKRYPMRYVTAAMP